MKRGCNLHTSAGFSLVELATITAVVGILAAIAAPGWLWFANSRHLNAAQDEVYQIMRQTQREASQQRVRKQVSFRQIDSQLQWAVHSANAAPTRWQMVRSNVQLSLRNTTLARSGQFYRLQFDERGNVNGQLGRLTLVRQGRGQRCVFVSTLLGELRKAKDQACRV